MNHLQTMPQKFRAWDRTKKRFIYFDFLNCEFLNSLYPDPDRYIIAEDTGFRDKNGKSIYTGDVIELTEHEYDPTEKADTVRTRIAPVVYENGHVALKIERPSCSGGDYLILLGCHPSEELKVLGNIWEM